MAARGEHTGINWKAPLIMSAAFIAGTTGALAHHLFYQWLNQQDVDKSVFNQQYNSNIGNACAFLVRALTSLAIGTAYWQVFWRTLQRTSWKIGHIDALYSLIRSIVAFIEVKALYRHPLLVGLALLSWTLPLATIFTPGTLSVINVPVLRDTTAVLAFPLFSNTTMAQTINETSGEKFSGPEVSYVGPTRLLSRLATGTAIQGTIPLVEAPATNSSYEMRFMAPTLQCSSTMEPSLLDFLDPMGSDGQFPLVRGNENYTGASWFSYDYISWTPGSSSWIPWNLTSVNLEALLPFNTASSDALSPYLGQYSGFPPSLFVAFRGSDWNVLNCSFFNANHTVHFNFTNGISTITPAKIRVLREPLQLSPSISSISYSPSGDSETQNYLNPTQIGYQALIDSFCRLLVGTIGYEHIRSDVGQGLITTPISQLTSVMSTNLANSQELRPLDPSDSAVANPPTLAASLEELFQNVTSALFSRAAFTSIENVPETELRVSTMTTRYHYSKDRLLLAYGIVVGCTCAVVILGWAMIFSNSATYSNEFSTIMRMTRAYELDAVVHASDKHRGADPLPQEIAQTRLHAGARASFASSPHDMPQDVAYENIAMLPPKGRARL